MQNKFDSSKYLELPHSRAYQRHRCEESSMDAPLQTGTISSIDGTDLALDVTGNVYVTGYTRGNLDGVPNNGADDFLVTKYSDSGTKKWSKLLGTVAGDQGNGISVDAAGNS